MPGELVPSVREYRVLDPSVAITGTTVVVGVVVAPVVLRDAVVVMVVTRDRSWDRGSADDPENGEGRCDPGFCGGEHRESFPWLVAVHVTKLEMARSIAGPCCGHRSGGAAPTTTVVALAPATRQAISRYLCPLEDV